MASLKTEGFVKWRDLKLQGSLYNVMFTGTLELRLPTVKAKEV